MHVGLNVLLVLMPALWLVHATGEQHPVLLPPEIVRHPEAEVAYKPGERVLLPCRAVGDAELLYSWRKDGEVIDLELWPDLRLHKNGTLELERPEDGIYQCFVSNGFGTAVSWKSVVKVAVLETFPTVNQVSVQRPVVGTYLKLECQPPRCYPSGNVYWGEIGTDGKLRPIDNSDRISLDYDGNLHLVNVELGDERNSATYVCVVQNPVLRSLVQGSDQKIDVSTRSGAPVYSAPKLVWSTPSSAIAIKAQELRMKCIFSGYPTPRVTWKRLNGGQIDADRYSGLNQQELIISEVTHDDEGRYECAATNQASSQPTARQEFTVTVQSPPYWRQQMPSNINAMEEDDVRFDCEVSGIPAPTVTWTINGQPVDALPADSRRTVGRSFLEYTNVTRSDSQVVQCNASNDHGYIFGNAYLRVRAEPATFTGTLPRETKTVKGRSVVLTCRATGAPKPTVSWTKDTHAVVNETDHVLLHSSGDLEILNARFEDEGEYKCNIRNKFGTEEAVGHLYVRDNMALTSVFEPVTVVAPSPIQLRCTFDVDELDQQYVNVEWLHDDVQLQPGGADDLRSSSSSSFAELNTRTTMILTMNVTRASDSGLYTCRASTDLETVESSAQVIVKDRPDRPTSVDFTDCQLDTTDISFVPGNSNNDNVTIYTVVIRSNLLLSSLSSSSNSDLGVSSTTMTVPAYGDSRSITYPLLPWRNYSFSVSVQNSIGTSDKTTSQQLCVTPPDVPTVNPRAVCGRQGASDELVIVWDEVSLLTVNGEGFHYLVTYRRQDLDESEATTEKVFNVKQTELVVGNQETFRPYEVTVRAANNEGTSADEANSVTVYSGQAKAQLTPSDVHIVDGTLNSSSVTVAWKPVDETASGINGFFVGYQVKYWKSNDRSTEKQVLLEVNSDARKNAMCSEAVTSRRRRSTVDDNDVTVSIDDLWPFAALSLTVSVVNGAGVGQASDPIEFNTPEGIPSVVPYLDVTEVGSTHMKLHWSSPDQPNGIVNNYIVEYVDSQGETAELVVTDQKVALYNLDPSSSYTISVCAATSAGCSEKKVVNRETLKLAAPDKPAIIDIQPGDNWANVSWERSVGGGSVQHPASEYSLQYRQVNDKNGQKVTPPAAWKSFGKERERQWINLTGLVQSADYAVRVVAVATAGYESHSDERQFVAGPPLLRQAVDQPEINSASTPVWVIIVILICVAIIVIIIVIVVFVMKKRRQPNKYPVKEPLANNKDLSKTRPADEEKCLSGISPKSNSTAPYPLAASSASLISSKSEPDVGGGNDSDDLDSLADDPDVTKFNEDGSFIGIYVQEPASAENFVGDDDEDTRPLATLAGSTQGAAVTTTSNPNGNTHNTIV